MVNTGSESPSPIENEIFSPFCFTITPCSAERHRHPLIFLDSAVVMRIEKREITVFIKRDLLEVETRCVDMSADDAHAVGDRMILSSRETASDPYVTVVDRNAGLQSSALCDDFVEYSGILFPQRLQA